MTKREKIEMFVLISITILTVLTIVLSCVYISSTGVVALAEETIDLCVPQVFSNVDYPSCSIYSTSSYICQNTFSLVNSSSTIFDKSVFINSNVTDLYNVTNDSLFGVSTSWSDGYVSSYFGSEYALQFNANLNTYLQCFITDILSLYNSSTTQCTEVSYVYNSVNYFNVFGVRLILENGKIIDFDVWAPISYDYDLSSNTYNLNIIRTIKVNNSDYVSPSVQNLSFTSNDSPFYYASIRLGSSIVNSDISKIYYRASKYNNGGVVYTTMPLMDFQNIDFDKSFVYAWSIGDLYTYSNLMNYAIYNNFFDNLYSSSYSDGYSQATHDIDTIDNSTWLSGIFNSFSSFFSIKLFGNVTVGLLLFIPLILSVLLFIFKLARG